MLTLLFANMASDAEAKHERRTGAPPASGPLARGTVARPLLFYLDDLSFFHGDGYRVFCSADGEVIVWRLGEGPRGRDTLWRQQRHLSPVELAELRALIAEAAAAVPGTLAPSRPLIPDEVPLKLGYAGTKAFTLHTVLPSELPRQAHAIQALAVMGHRWAAPAPGAVAIQRGRDEAPPWPAEIARPEPLAPPP